MFFAVLYSTGAEAHQCTVPEGNLVPFHLMVLPHAGAKCPQRAASLACKLCALEGKSGATSKIVVGRAPITQVPTKLHTLILSP